MLRFIYTNPDHSLGAEYSTQADAETAAQAALAAYVVTVDYTNGSSDGPELDWTTFDRSNCSMLNQYRLTLNVGQTSVIGTIV